jgi:enoyl-[acyl-carrier protein] reductase I
MQDLTGQRGLVLGIANDSSIATGCAAAFRAAGAEVAITVVNQKARRFVEPVAERLGLAPVLDCDVREAGQLEAVFAALDAQWGGLDFLLHSIAFAPREDLHGRVVDCSAEGFAMAMDVSVHSFIRCARLAEPLLKKRGGGTLLTVTFYGAERVVAHYNMMGPVKAALEGVVRYLAAELGPAGIRVHAISPGPIATRAASGIDRFDEMMERAAATVPAQGLARIEDVGAAAAFLVGAGAARLNGLVLPVDGGSHVLA